MKIIKWIYKDCPVWNVTNPYSEEDYKTWMDHERNVQPPENIRETETGATIFLYRYQ